MTTQPEPSPLELPPLSADADSTQTENPFAKMVKAAVCDAFQEQRVWWAQQLKLVIDEIAKVNTAPLELAQKATEGRVRGHSNRLNSLEKKLTGFEQRLTQLEREARARPTDPAPAPGE
jgi:hypothetical protein